jgi:hypothetical protein
MYTDNEKKEDSIVVSVFKDLWADPAGRILIIVGGGIFCLFVTGEAFKAGAHTVRGAREFLDAFSKKK